MKTHIVNIRGTNGSGKTTAVRAIMSRLQHVRDYTTQNGVFTHVYHTPDKFPVLFIGKYDDAASGGVDRVKSIRDLVEAVAEISIYGHVVMEGLLLSGLQQLTLDIAAKSPNSVYHALTLDTPKEKCIEQTLKRRAIVGNEKPFDPKKSLLPKYRAVELAHAKLLANNMDARVVSQRDAVVITLELLGMSDAAKNVKI